MTIKQAVIGIGAITALSNQDVDRKFNIKPSVRIDIALIGRKLVPVSEAYEQERLRLIKEFAGPADTNGNISVPNEKLESFLAAIKEVQNKEIDISFKPIALSELSEAQVPISITMDLLEAGILKE